MNDAPLRLEPISFAAARLGLALRGGVRLAASERVDALAGARAILLFGFVGAEPWPIFAASAEARDGAPHPLDRWSRRVVATLGRQFSGTPLFPFEGPPYWPFQAWALRAEPVFPSPLGLLVHPDFGLSHSYRGALVFSREVALPQLAARTRPCDTCSAKPCLTTCPVGAFSREGYVVETCASWLMTPSGADCMSGGCQARRACPVGPEYAQSREEAHFHMKAFLAARAGAV